MPAAERQWTPGRLSNHNALCCSFISLQAWAENKVPMMPPGGDLSKDRKVEQKVDVKKKTQAEIEQEMAALQYTNPMLLEVGASTC